MSNSSAWTGASSQVQYRVHLGTWTDWSRGGSVLGATLTVKRAQGSLLIAFTAFFIGVVSTSFWRIARLVLYRLYSTPAPRDALYHQRQALLRNSLTPAASLWAFSVLGWTWRRDAPNGLLRVLPTVASAVICISAFTVAGGFSSQLSTGIGNAVLLDGSHCGHLQEVDGMNSSHSAFDLYPHVVRQIENAANYAQQCYSASSAGMFDCATFVKGHLPTTVNREAPCPFQGGICRSNNSNLLLDTGFMDSQQHLGLNSPPDQRILFRTILHCAPLVTEGYKTDGHTPSHNFTQYHYGRYSRFHGANPSGNVTLQVESQYSQYHRGSDIEYRSPVGDSFSLRTFFAHVENRTVLINRNPRASVFIPIPELFRPDGEMMLVFLSANGVLFSERSPDPWYRGIVPDREHQYRGINVSPHTVYQAEEAASPMGCLWQAQFCNSSHYCGPLASFIDAGQALFDVDPQGPTPSRLNWIIPSIIEGAWSLNMIPTFLQGESLQSKQHVSQGNVFTALTDQWQTDITHWWATMLASVQETFVSRAAPPLSPELEQYIIPPSNQYAKELCNNQKILSTQYTSFSLFGLYFTYLVGALIIGLSYALEPILASVARRWRKNDFTNLEWTSNQTLQLQRAAYQGVGSGTWTGFTRDVPKTKGGETLVNLTTVYADEGESEMGMKSAIGPTQSTSNESQRAPSRQTSLRSGLEEMGTRDRGLELMMTGSTTTAREDHAHLKAAGGADATDSSPIRGPGVTSTMNDEVVGPLARVASDETTGQEAT